MANWQIRVQAYDSKYVDQLRTVFFTSIRQSAKDYYNEEQLNAWAPEKYDNERWRTRIEAIRPFIATMDEVVVGYADIQPSGYIDHFFVKGGMSGKGIGTILMTRLFKEAEFNAVPVLYSDVSLAARSFFERHGFEVVEEKNLTIEPLSKV